MASLSGPVLPGPDSTYLCTLKADYTDFVFTCEMKMADQRQYGRHVPLADEATDEEGQAGQEEKK